VIPILFIMGAGRSGSTLMERLLGTSPATVVCGEQRLVWSEGFTENHLCSCGRPFLSCPFYESVRRIAAELDPALMGMSHMMRWAKYMDSTRFAQHADWLRWIPKMYAPRLRSMEFEVEWRQIHHALVTWYSAIHRAADQSIIIDSTKDPGYAHLLGTVPEFNVGYIHLVRDSRGVAFSWTRRNIRPEVINATTMMDRKPMWRSALDWDAKYALSSLLRLVRPGRVIELQYEWFAREPETGLAAIRQFAASLRMPPLESSDPSASPWRYHSVFGNPIRFERKPPHVKVDDEWRQAMRPRDRLVVTALTAPFLVGHHAVGSRNRRFVVDRGLRMGAGSPPAGGSESVI